MATDVTSKILEILNSLTLDAQHAASDKCEELGFDPDKGEITLTEAFINLTSAVNILSEAVTAQKLGQFPLTIQKDILSKVESVSKFIISLTGGADEVINLVDSIEQLNTAIWSSRIDSFSSDILGFHTKMNQLKHQEVLLKSMNDKLEEGLSKKEELISLLAQAVDAKAQSEAASEQTKLTATTAAETLAKIITASQKAETKTEATIEHETSAEKHAANSRASLAEVVTMEAKIKAFFAEIDVYKQKIAATSDNASKTVFDNNEKTEKLIDELSTLEKSIEKQIQDATGYSLFHSFQTRQLSIVNAKNRWAFALLALLILALAFTVFLVITIGAAGTLGVAFFLKLSISIPIISAITFCTIQYSRERRLEEEYAFKSAISISLDPYQKLVNSLGDQSSPEERKQFAAFILDAIQKVFTSPTEKIFAPKQKEVKFDKALKQTAEIAGIFAKAGKI